jgi:hypothetical protein
MLRKESQITPTISDFCAFYFKQCMLLEVAVLTTIVYPSLQKETCILLAKDERGASNYLTQF